MNSTGIDNGNGVFFTESSSSKTIKFALLVAGQSISIVCYIFIILYFILHRPVRNAVYNHVVFVSLLMNFPIISINVTLHLIYIQSNVLLPSTAATCLLWQYLDYGFWFGDLTLKMWTAIERHILIFHSNLLNTRWRKILVHYTPMALFTLYCPLVYIYLIFFYPTIYTYDFSVLLCGGPYYYNGIPTWLIWYESLVHYVLPIFLMVLVAAALPIRVYLQKARLRVKNGWRQYRKMTIQMVNISVIYVFTLPYIMVTIVRWSGYPDFGIDVQGPYFYYCNYIPNMVFPLATILSIKSLRQKLFRWFHPRTNRRGLAVAPLTTVNPK